MNANFSLVAELERLASALSADGGDATKLSLQSVGVRIAKVLNVKPDEVAIMGLSTRWKHLYFLVPENLAQVGYIPLSSNSALAARTARESRPEINNNFATVRHASVFEGVKVAGEPTQAIQKIISAPILSEARVVGIIQISRKGDSVASAGPDFTPSDLGQVLALCKPLGKLLRHVADPQV
ncbi:MAG TPA: GAF domain-containing protein [Candidatus Acidoferrum sp.]|jgi:GAF domain-containing protein